mgnify:CR=1 FL=1
MTLALTPAMLETAYEYLRSTPPFCAWKLPPAEEVEFGVTRHRDREGDHCVYQRTTDHVIRVSAYYVKTTSALMCCMAHEMIHAYQERKGGARYDRHNAEFKRLTIRVCSVHGWNPDAVQA